MLGKIRSWLVGAQQAPASACAEQDLHLASLALLVFAAQLDGDFDSAEHHKINEIAQIRFGLSPEMAQDIVNEASKVAAQTTDLFSLTNEINNHLDVDLRVSVIEMLWDVAYADGVLNDYEANLVRRVAGLLYVEDHVSGAARQRVLQRRKIAENEMD